jgi:thiol-disulfide isomerase/thioredoxin
MKKILLPVFILSLLFVSFSNVLAKNSLEIHFFYSETCAHCRAEQKFLDGIEKDYPNVKINRYVAADSSSRKLLIDLAREHEAEQYIGLVPLTFIGEEFFLGFDDEDNIGEKIKDSIERQLNEVGPSEEDDNKVKLPIIGEVDLSKYSLPAQAAVLGFFDGFNVCSLGALILILGLVLVLRSRAKIFLFGGIFILTTAIIYGLLIVLWYQLFYYLAPVLKILNILVGVLGILGGVYFIRQFIKYRKYGPTCDLDTGDGVIGKFSVKLQKSFKESGGMWGILISVLIFAAVVTVVEFPCSAVIPVFFAGALAQAELPTLTYLLYIAIFILFYMLDEIIIFLIAVFTMTLKIASSKAIVWITLLEAIILFGLGFYYLFGF